MNICTISFQGTLIVFKCVNLFTLYYTLMPHGLQSHPHAGENRTKLDAALGVLYRMSASDKHMIHENHSSFSASFFE